MTVKKNYNPQLPEPVNVDWDSQALLLRLAEGYNQLIAYLAAHPPTEPK